MKSCLNCSLIKKTCCFEVEVSNAWLYYTIFLQLLYFKR
jgi:hypothetical protein